MSGKSLGGYPTGQATPAQQAGVAPSTSIAPRLPYSAVVGGQDWVGEDQCVGTLKDSGWPCEAKRREGHITCFGHRNQETTG